MSTISDSADFNPAEDEDCLTCAENRGLVEMGQPEEYPLHECPGSRRDCGHHCNHSWEQDTCHWCGAETAEEGEYMIIPDHCGVYPGSHVSPHRQCMLR